jgi:hypothetical protein
MKKHIPVSNFLIRAAIVLITFDVASPSSAAGLIDAGTVIAVPHGTFSGVHYTRYEAMFAGVTPDNRPYRVPCQIIAPANPQQGAGLLLFDWLVESTIVTAVGQEQADTRYFLTDELQLGHQEISSVWDV